MAHYRPEQLVAAVPVDPRRFQRLLTVLLGVLFALFANLVSAMSKEPSAATPVTRALAPLTEPDLMEMAFREGMKLYEAGNYAAATQAWRAPAEHGHAAAQFSLGVAYATGHGVPEDLASAIRWWKAAARHGHVTAQVNLGLLYWRGVGVDKDLAKAREWWQRAADGGDAVAQFHLGAMAATGEGMPINYDEAVRWWRLAAAQGYEQAIKGLEILRSHGLVADKTN